MPITPSPEMVNDYPINHDLVPAAEAALIEARETREEMRRRYRKGNSYREAQVAMAMGRINSVMDVIRREVARINAVKPTGVDTYAADVKRLSDALQRERRKLWKMQWRPIDGLDWGGPPALVTIEADEYDRLVEAAAKAGYKVASEPLAEARG